MRIYFLIFFCVFSAATVHAACNNNMPASTPDSQLIDNGDGTITDLKTGLMWKQCLEGLSGTNCTEGNAKIYNWQEALQLAESANTDGGFAGYTDWRLPNVKELLSIVEHKCSSPSINLTFFHYQASSGVWSSSPGIRVDGAWCVFFDMGFGVSVYERDRVTWYVRLVRGGS